ncbi:PREDICTED: nardilysin-like [Habropoda laboriosa]|uniref:nardilysin-like n=1 Tax=Habropoda laboriosa TaxID=597456 RepID=UPI00083D0144|nr:PREDICTED: nardilysin-like [Habropoda laboriosa]
MVTRLRKYLFMKVFQCGSRKASSLTTVPKTPLQSPPEKKLKPNQGSINAIRNTSFLREHNLTVGTMTADEIQTESCIQDGSVCVTKLQRGKTVYLDAPIKSQNDKKEYRVMKLENGLTALLISDPHSLSSEDNESDGKADAVCSENDDEEMDEETDSNEDDKCEEGSDQSDSDGEDSSTCSKQVKREEKMAACGLSVNVGSYSDPIEIQGLAHFLEHMVFMGSEKYSQENDFDAFIKNRGGSNNATTDCELTTFYFEIQEKHLLSALDRFAQFFIKPLMKKDAITREREAVESEFQEVLPSDYCRQEQLFRSFAYPDHPAAKFTWGNLVTLRDGVTDDKLYDALHKFRERHYSAHRMKLAIQARLPLDVLEDYVTQCFASVPSNGLPPDDFTAFKKENAFNTSRFRRIYRIKPIKNVCRVELIWSLPPVRDLYRSKPYHYVSWIIGYKGKGSLISYLRKKMWCLEIFSEYEHCSMYTLSCLSLVLTEQGYKHLLEVLNAVFSFINMVRKEGPQKRIYDEIHQIKETDFRFTDEEPPVEYVEDLCEEMHYYPPCDYITGQELYFEYNPEDIERYLNYLRPGDVNIIISNKKFNDEEFDKVEPWFKTKYTDTVIPNKWIECWRTIEPYPEYHLPLPNDFLTDDFSLIPTPVEVPKYPTQIHSDELIEIWYRPDTKFALPECYMYFYIISPTAVASLKGVVMMELYVTLLQLLLVEVLFPATVASLSHEIYSTDMGIALRVNGFNQKLPLLLVTIAKCIAKSPELTEEFFEVIKETQAKSYYNTFKKRNKLIVEVRLSILMQTHWTSVDKHVAINTVKFNEFQSFIKYFTDHVYIKCLVQGNMTQEDVIENVQGCVKILKCGPLLPNTMPQMRITQIPIGKHYCKIKNLNGTDANSVVKNYYQSGITSVKLSILIDLLILLMEEPLFNQLRTQEQLGYDVSCTPKNTYGILGYSIMVCTQADKYTTEHVDNRIEAFLEMFNNILKEITEKDFDRIKETLIKLKQHADIHLKEEVDRNWLEIIFDDYMFDRIEKQLQMIEHIKIDELREWLNSHAVGGSNFRKLSIQIVGTPTNTDKEKNESVHSENNEANK